MMVLLTVFYLFAPLSAILASFQFSFLIRFNFKLCMIFDYVDSIMKLSPLSTFAGIEGR